MIIYRAGWPSKVQPPRRAGWCWAWIGPYVIGWGWDRTPRPDGKLLRDGGNDGRAR